MSNSPLGNLALQERTRREILHRSDLIPPLPDFVVRLLSLLSKPETEPRDLERHLQSDQVLVAKMLAMVNSPFYGLNRSISTIKEAVMVLGFRGLRSLILATSTAKFLQRDFTCYGHDEKGLWTHAAAVAAAAKNLARSCRLGAESAEQLFVAGLLHDIGKLLLVPYVNDRHVPADAHHESTDAMERAVIGMDHTEAGALVAAKWNLSEELQEVLKGHHDKDVATHYPKSVAIVRLADALAHERGFGYLPGRAPKPVYLPCDLALLGLDSAMWDEARNDMASAMDDAVACLGTLSH